MTTKLEETFGLPKEESEMIAELEKRYNCSTDPNLKEIAQLALKAYKEQMLDTSNFEPKYRARNLEVAQTFLALAKDALAKDEDLRLKAEKQDQTKKPEKDKPVEGETMNRDDFLKQVEQAGNKK